MLLNLIGYRYPKTLYKHLGNRDCSYKKIVLIKTAKKKCHCCRNQHNLNEKSYYFKIILACDSACFQGELLTSKLNPSW